MMRSFLRSRSFCAGLVALALVAGCKGSDSGSGPRNPVRLVFLVQPIHGGLDTLRGTMYLDTNTVLHFPEDTLENVAQGTHTITVYDNIDYLPLEGTLTINTPHAQDTVILSHAASCRDATPGVDEITCSQHNNVYNPTRTDIVCPVNDWGEFCAVKADGGGIGATWPDTGLSSANSYVFWGRLLIAATSNGHRLATAAYSQGDYAPAHRLTNNAYSTIYQTLVYTDYRHNSDNDADPPRLPPTARPGQNFGLGVRTTYFLPPNQPDILMMRFDVTNVSADTTYRRVHPEEPVGGHTLTNIYLSPFIDADIGGQASITSANPPQEDDNATLFMPDSLLVTYDQNFLTNTFSPSYAAQPGMVGLRLVNGPPGTTAKGVITREFVSIDYTGGTPGTTDDSPLKEDTAYSVISGARDFTLLPNQCTNTTLLLYCSTEAAGNVRMAWSVGPIATLAPGETTTLTVALIFAKPGAGFASGTDVPPQNNAAGDTTRTIYRVGAPLRTLGAQSATINVNGAPLFSFRRR
jgi:hypothetical protein